MNGGLALEKNERVAVGVLLKVVACGGERGGDWRLLKSRREAMSDA